MPSEYHLALESFTALVHPTAFLSELAEQGEPALGKLPTPAELGRA